MRTWLLAASLGVTVVCGALIPVVSHGQAPAQPRSFVLEESTVADVSAAMESGALTCQKLTELYLARIAAYDKAGPRLNSIITVNPKAVATAQALDAERRAQGPRSRLHCIPVLLKDNIDTADMPTSNGSAILRDAVPPDDAFIVTALRNAGALILGKASMGEFAGTGYNTVQGQVHNAYNILRQTGGSSAGSGASISANLAILSIGTDTSQSVRDPAAYNGIVGLRPTTGLVSRDGIAPKNLLFDTAGPIARTVTDVALLLSAIAAPDPKDPLGFSARVYAAHPTYQTAPRAPLARTPGSPQHVDYTTYLKRGSLKGARIGVARQYFVGDPEIVALTDAAIAKLKELGATIVDPVPFDGTFVNTVRTIADYRFKEDWETYLATFGPAVPKTVKGFLDLYDNVVDKSSLHVEASIRRLLTDSLTHSSSEEAYQTLVNKTLPDITKKKLEILDGEKLDALVMPYSATFAAPIDNPMEKVTDPTWKVFANVVRPQTLAGYSSVGFPAIVVPMGFGSTGLPMDLMLLAKPYEEGKLLAYAFDYEQATKMRRPSPLVPPLPGESVSYPASR